MIRLNVNGKPGPAKRIRKLPIGDQARTEG